MFLTDYHLHTNYSIDSQVSIMNRVKWAVENGINEICLTDHMEREFREVNYNVHDFAKYKREIQEAQEFYGDKIKIKFGMELGLIPHLHKTAKEIVKNYDFDFIIGSTHEVNKVPLYERSIYYDGKEKIVAFNEYLEEVLSNSILFDEYDVYGHFDYVYRYSNYPDNKLRYSDHAEIIDEIFKNFADRGKGIEINLSGVRYGHNSFHPNLEILKAFKRQGGEIVTIGSDTHNLQEARPLIIQAQDMMKEAGFDYITTFEKRQPSFIKI